MKMPWRGGIAEMLGCVQLPQNPLEMAVLERQQMQLRQEREQQQQQQINVTNGDPSNLQTQPFVVPACFPPAMAGEFPKDLQLQGLMQLHAWPDMLQYPIMGELEHPSSNLASGSNTIYGTSTNVECPPNAYAEEMSSSGLRKRKTERPQTPPVNRVDSEDKKVNGEKRVRCEGGGGVVLHQPKQEVQTSNSKSGKAASKAASEVVQKTDYVHVRARRGQATDSHSLAERARREKISERMKYLQDLVPGCNKITGKAGMLDVIINYVQSLQNQVEFLSMKLAAANPVFDFSALELSVLKENVAACSGGLQVTMAMPPDPMSSPLASSSSMVQPATPNGGLGLTLNLQEVQFNNTASDPATASPNYTMDVHNFNVAGANSSPVWDATLQSILPVANFNSMPIDPNYQTTSGCNIN